MTNEEFEGHLMSALHGPNAEKIANRIGAVLISKLAKDIVTMSKDEAVAAFPFLDNLSEAAFKVTARIDDLEMLAHLGDTRTRQEDGFDGAMKRAAMKSMLMKHVRTEIRNSRTGSAAGAELLRIAGLSAEEPAT